MIDFNSFKSELLGKTYDYDHVDGFQCTDIPKLWLERNTGEHIGTMGNAINWWNAPKPQLLALADRIPAQTASMGDIVVKHPNHVGVATGQATATQVEILEQNGATGNGKGQGNDKIRTRFINRPDIAGVYRIKGFAPQTVSIRLNGTAKNTYYVRETPGGNPFKDLAHGTEEYGAVIGEDGWARITFTGKTGYVGPRTYTRF